MIRIGSADYEPSPIVFKYTLDQVIAQELKRSSRYADYSEVDKINLEVDRLALKRDKLKKIMEDKPKEEKAKIQKQIEEIGYQRGKLLNKAGVWRNSAQVIKRNANMIETDVVSKAQIIFSTLSMSGIDLIEKLELE